MKISVFFLFIFAFSVFAFAEGERAFWAHADWDSDDVDEIEMPDGSVRVQVKFEDNSKRIFTETEWTQFKEAVWNRFDEFIRNPDQATFDQLDDSQKVDVAKRAIQERALADKDDYSSSRVPKHLQHPKTAEHLYFGQNYFAQLSEKQQNQVTKSAIWNETFSVDWDHMERNCGGYSLCPVSPAREAIYEENFAITQKLFNLLTRNSFDAQREYICDQLKSPRDDQNTLVDNYAWIQNWRVEKLIQRSVNAQQLSSAYCKTKLYDPEREDIFSIKEALEFKWGQLKKILADRAAKQRTLLASGVSQTFLPSKCKFEQLVSAFSDTTNAFKFYKGPLASHIVVQQSSCMVQGVAYKSNTGKYTFIPRSHIPGQVMPTIPFTDATDIAKKLLPYQISQ